MSSRRKDNGWEDRAARRLRGRSLHEPPEHVLRRAVALAARLPEPGPSSVGRLVALLFDSAAEPLPAGVRGGGLVERRVLFEIRPYEKGRITNQLDVRLRREEGGAVQVTGQLLPPSPGTRLILKAARSRRKRELGEQGTFLIRGLPGGTKVVLLEIEFPEGGTVQIPPIPLDPAASTDR